MRTLSILACVLTTSVADAQPGLTPPTSTTEPGPWTYHEGLTFEGNLGVGHTHSSYLSGLDTYTLDTDVAIAGAIGLGGWITPRVALGVRMAGVQVKLDAGHAPATGLMVHAFVGPNVQYWLTPNIWIGGGIGLATEELFRLDPWCSSARCRSFGLGVDLRAGYSFDMGGRSTLTISAEANTGIYWVYTPYGPNDGSTTGVSIVAGYQYL